MVTYVTRLPLVATIWIRNYLPSWLCYRKSRKRSFLSWAKSDRLYRRFKRSWGTYEHMEALSITYAIDCLQKPSNNEFSQYEPVLLSGYGIITSRTMCPITCMEPRSRRSIWQTSAIFLKNRANLGKAPGIRYPAASKETAKNHTKGLKENNGTSLDDEGINVVHSWRFPGVEVAQNTCKSCQAKICWHTSRVGTNTYVPQSRHGSKMG